MTNDSIRDHCLSLPMTTEEIQWEEHLLFKIGGKMFAITTLGGHRCNFKCTPEKYADLVEMPNIEPSSHNMWKYQWLTTETLTALPDAEFRELLTESYNLVRASLSKKFQAELEAGRQPKVKKWVPKAEREKKAAKKIVKKVAKKAKKSKVAKRAKR
jgi:predicted DNA-binding protein (MmcQ/YjbR family)